MGKRIVAFLIDHLVICFLFMLIGLAEMFVTSLDSKFFWVLYGITLLFIMCIYFLKDIINGQSIGKRIMKIKVVDEKGNVPNAIRLILRNITILIWPVEALFVLLEKKKIGDRLAKTKVVEMQ